MGDHRVDECRVVGVGEPEFGVDRLALPDRLRRPQSSVVEQFAKAVARRRCVEILHDFRLDARLLEDSQYGARGRASGIVINDCSRRHG